MSYVKAYRYKIKQADLPKLQEINTAATKVYQRYGKITEKLLTKNQSEYTEVLYLEFYSSKEDFQCIFKQANNDTDLQKPWNSFQSIVIGPVEEDEYELHP